MSLADELDQRRVHSSARWSPEERAEREQAALRLAESSILDDALGVGDRAPDFVLRDIAGAAVATDALRSRAPLIVVFYRGGWCPYCNLELRAWQRVLDQVTAAGASLVAISPEVPEVSAATSDDGGLHFPVLSDVGNEVARAFGIVHAVSPASRARMSARGQVLEERQGCDEPSLPLPATFVIDRDGVIRYAFVDTDYTRRAEPSEVIAAVRSLTG